MRELLEEFTHHDRHRSAVALVVDFTLYFSLTAVAVLATSVWVKTLAVIGAGTAISMLFILGHDAAHRALMPSRRLNDVLTRIVFFPCLHNASLWWIEHNWAHHQFTNVKGRNSFSPMSPQEYAQASFVRRSIERLYRNPLGFGIYYLVERWWKHKFIPFHHERIHQRSNAWADFALLLLWVVALSTGLVWLDAEWGADEPLVAVLWGFVAPFLVWNQLMGTTAFLQHTHPTARWSEESSDPKSRLGQVELTVLVNFPRWYDLLSHNIMQHPAHHVNPRIPWHRLYEAQRRLSAATEVAIISETMTPLYVLSLCRTCQVYDYENNAWGGFAQARTRDTTPPVLLAAHQELALEQVQVSNSGDGD